MANVLKRSIIQEAIAGDGGQSYLNSDPSLEGDTKRLKTNRVEVARADKGKVGRSITDTEIPLLGGNLEKSIKEPSETSKVEEQEKRRSLNSDYLKVNLVELDVTDIGIVGRSITDTEIPLSGNKFEKYTKKNLVSKIEEKTKRFTLDVDDLKTNLVEQAKAYKGKVGRSITDTEIPLFDSKLEKSIEEPTETSKVEEQEKGRSPNSDHLKDNLVELDDTFIRKVGRSTTDTEIPVFGSKLEKSIKKKKSRRLKVQVCMTIGGALSATKSHQISSNPEAIKTNDAISVLTLSLKKANSVRNSSKFIYDTAAGCNICNSKDVFVDGSIVMLREDEVSIVGWNTSHGSAIAIGKGILKSLMIEAYYSIDSIGNILGEAEVLKTHKAIFKYHPGRMYLDKITLTKLDPKEGDMPLIFQRGIEGIMICPVPGSKVEPSSHKTSDDDWVVCSTLISDENDPVSVWLKVYGLTEREIQAAVVLRKLSKENRNTSVKKLICVLENDCKCKADKVLAKYLIFKSMYDTELEIDNKVMSHSSEIIGSLRSWLPMSESSVPKSTEKETLGNKTLENKNSQKISNWLNSKRSSVKSHCDNKLCSTHEDSFPESLASCFSDSEAWAALSIAKLRLSYGELMVALFAVDVGLASADTFAALTLKQKGFSLAGIARLGQVERLHRLTSFVNLRTLKDMLKNEVITVDGLKPQEVDDFRKHVHELDCPCNEGKVKQPSAIKGVNLAQLNNASCHIDVMTFTTDDKTRRYLNLVGVDAFTQCVIEVRVSDVAAGALATGLIVIENWYKKYKRPLEQFVLDNAASFKVKDLQDECARRGITIVYVTPDLHVKLAELAIKIIKSLARTTVLDRESKGKFITSFVTHLITWVVGSINFTLRRGSRTKSPWERFTAIQI